MKKRSIAVRPPDMQKKFESMIMMTSVMRS